MSPPIRNRSGSSPRSTARAPQYSDQRVTAEQGRHQWRKIAGPEGSKAAVAIRQDASIFTTSRRTQLHVEATEPTGAWPFDLA
jgi:hypothetical protein